MLLIILPTPKGWNLESNGFLVPVIEPRQARSRMKRGLTHLAATYGNTYSQVPCRTLTITTVLLWKEITFKINIQWNWSRPFEGLRLRHSKNYAHHCKMTISEYRKRQEVSKPRKGVGRTLEIYWSRLKDPQEIIELEVLFRSLYGGYATSNPKCST